MIPWSLITFFIVGEKIAYANCYGKGMGHFDEEDEGAGIMRRVEKQHKQTGIF